MYEYNEFAQCKDVGTFANDNKWKLIDGTEVGRNILYELFYDKKVLRDKHSPSSKSPYADYKNYFVLTYKNGWKKGKFIENRVPLITPEGQEYFKKKVPEWIAEGWIQPKKRNFQGVNL